MYPTMCYYRHMMNTSETRISIRFPLDVLQALRALAQQHERSFNGEVIWALRYYIQAQKGEKQHGKKSL